MNAAMNEDFSQMHEPHWVLRGAFQLLVFGLVLVEVMLALAVQRELIWLAVPLVLVLSHLMHGILIGLHEAAHGLLRKNRRFNEFDGIVMATLSLMSFSLYRVVHQTHHAYLATERDYEFWPLSHTTTPRSTRCLAAFIELNFGLVYTPFLYWHCGNRGGHARHRAIDAGTEVAADVELPEIARYDLWRRGSVLKGCCRSDR